MLESDLYEPQSLGAEGHLKGEEMVFEKLISCIDFRDFIFSLSCLKTKMYWVPTVCQAQG